MRLALLPLLLLLGCGDSLNLVSVTVIKVESPTPNGTVFSLDPLVFRVTATNQTGVASVDLSAGSVLLKTCSADKGSTLTCEVTTSLGDIAAQIKSGTLHLTVTATDRKNAKVKKTVGLDVFVKPIRISVTSPIAEGEPPVAIVKGTSTLSFDVKSEVAVESVNVKQESELPVIHFDSEPYSDQLDWPVKLKVGEHLLTATAKDVQGRTDNSYLTVRVLCQQATDCDLHQRCCSSGACEAEATTPACE